MYYFISSFFICEKFPSLLYLLDFSDILRSCDRNVFRCWARAWRCRGVVTVVNVILAKRKSELSHKPNPCLLEGMGGERGWGGGGLEILPKKSLLLAWVDAKLLQIMPKLQILLDKGNVTLNNNNKQKRFRLLNFLRAAHHLGFHDVTALLALLESWSSFIWNNRAMHWRHKIQNGSARKI